MRPTSLSLTVQQTKQSPAPRSRGVGLALARAGWVLIALLSLATLIQRLPAEHTRLSAVCAGHGCSHPRLTPVIVEQLRAHGMLPTAFVWYFLALDALFACFWLGSALVIFWRRSDDPMALSAATMLATGSLFVTSSYHPAASALWELPGDIATAVGGVAILFFFGVFPSGRLVHRWLAAPILIVAALGCLEYAAYIAGYDTSALILISAISECIGVVILVSAQVYQYRRMGDPTQRQQAKWVILGISGAICGFLLVVLLGMFAPTNNALMEMLGNTVIYVCMCLIPLSILLSILRYRLWDIDVLIHRALVYGALSLCVLAIYVVVVGYFSVALGLGSSPVISLLATAAVAIAVFPLSQRLQRGVSRLLYGQRDDPYAVLARLGARMEDTLEPEATLHAFVETVAQALRLPYVAITLRGVSANEEAPAVAAGYGEAPTAALPLPLTYQHEIVGELVLAQRSPGEDFSTADRALLATLARQAGVAAHAVQLTAALRRSREELVTAREEERRRLRRDLHDGLGPTLAALNLQAGAIRNEIARDPAAAMAQMDELRADLRAAAQDVRRLVYGLRPPALDELGLAGAVRQLGAQYRASDEERAGARGAATTPEILIEAPAEIEPLPAAVEVAAYRIAQEALNNVVKHAQAHRCVVEFVITDGLDIRVTDDGMGLPRVLQAGVGFASMRERAVELGGSCEVTRIPTGGTRVLARLPIKAVSEKGKSV